jgi:hypothetical protein
MLNHWSAKVLEKPFWSAEADWDGFMFLGVTTTTISETG